MSAPPGMIHCHCMPRLLTFLIICALFLGQGFSAGAAMCVHRSADAHAQALESGDATVAAVAQNEDEAASLMAKKAASSGAAGLNWVAHLAAPPVLVPPLSGAERVGRSFADAPPLKGVSTAPLLRPPLTIA